MELNFFKMHDNSLPPAKNHDEDAGWDIYADEDVELSPQYEPVLVRTGIKMAFPEGYACLILPRSGLACKYGVTVVNSPGLVDPGYRGELMVGLINHHPIRTHQVSIGDRIAQMVFIQTPKIVLDILEPDDGYFFETFSSARSEKGFGSSGY